MAAPRYRGPTSEQPVGRVAVEERLAEVDWAAMLAAGDVDGFNEKRGERTRPELFAADLAGLTLHNVDFSNANLEKSDLTESDLTDANLMRANLAGIDGSSMKLVHAVGMRARFKEAWMDAVDLTGADFSQANFGDANLKGSTGAHVRMSQARLRGVDAEGASWPEADLSEAKLHQAVFRGADLSNADLSAATGAEADFSGARLDGVRATEGKFAGARFVEARLGQAVLQRVNLAGADLSGADLSAADLSQANLQGANLTNAILKGAVLADANLTGVVLEGADLTAADLSGLDPVELGLSEEVVANLAAYGVSWDESAPWLFSSVSVARNGNDVAVVWVNPEGDEASSPRWAVWRGQKLSSGVLPIPADSLLDLQITAAGEGFLVAALRDRPEGAVVSALPIENGQLKASRSAPLGYEPAFRPELRATASGVQMLGLARRDNMLVITELSGEAPAIVASSKVPTAQGFLRGHTVLACKGGVVMPLQGNRAGNPRRTPEGFPGLRGFVAPMPDDDLLAVWAEPRQGRIPGGLRFATMGPRHAPQPEGLTDLAGVVALQGVREGDKLRVLWAEAGDDGLGPSKVRTCLLPGGTPTDLDVADDVTSISMAEGVGALIRLGGELLLIDPSNGKVLAAGGS